MGLIDEASAILSDPGIIGDEAIAKVTGEPVVYTAGGPVPTSQEPVPLPGDPGFLPDTPPNDAPPDQPSQLAAMGYFGLAFFGTLAVGAGVALYRMVR